MNHRNPRPPAGRASFSYPLTRLERDALQECVDKARADELEVQLPCQWKRLKSLADDGGITIPMRAILDSADPAKFRAVMGGKRGVATRLKAAFRKALATTPEPTKNPYAVLPDKETAAEKAERMEAHHLTVRRKRLAEGIAAANWFQDLATGEALKTAVTANVANLLQGAVTTTKGGPAWTALRCAFQLAGLGGDPKAELDRLTADQKIGIDDDAEWERANQEAGEKLAKQCGELGLAGTSVEEIGQRGVLIGEAGFAKEIAELQVDPRVADVVRVARRSAQHKNEVEYLKAKQAKQNRDREVGRTNSIASRTKFRDRCRSEIETQHAQAPFQSDRRGVDWLWKRLLEKGNPSPEEKDWRRRSKGYDDTFAKFYAMVKGRQKSAWRLRLP